MACGGRFGKKNINRADGSSESVSSMDDDSEAGDVTLIEPQNGVNYDTGHCADDASVNHSDCYFSECRIHSLCLDVLHRTCVSPGFHAAVRKY